MLSPHDDQKTADEFRLTDLEIECEGQARQKRDGLGGNAPSPEKTRQSMKWTRKQDSTR